MFNLAIESASQKTLDRIKKPLRIEEVSNLVELVRRKYPSAWIIGHYIVGFPFESRSDIEYTFKFSSELRTDWVLYSPFKPFPKTELHDYCVENKIITEYVPGAPLNISHIDGIDWEGTWLTRAIYEHNLRYNFLDNTNIFHRTGHYDQALRDFKYVTNITRGEHSLAYRQSALAARMMNDNDLARIMEEKERLSLVGNDEFIGWYKFFGLPLPA